MNYQDTNIDSLDLGPIKYKLMNPDKGEGWSLERVNEVEKRYKQFLFLNLKYDASSIVPDHDVDDFWHAHILDTMKYAEDCENVFGKFLHHFPYFGLRGEEDAQNLSDSYQETLLLYEQEFGVEDAFEFSKCSHCGGSTCGSSKCHSKDVVMERPHFVA